MTNSKGFTLAELARVAGTELDGEGAVTITGAAPIEKAEKGDISFVANPKYTKYIETTKASALILNPTQPSKLPTLRHRNPYLAMAIIIDKLYPTVSLVEAGTAENAVISPKAKIDPSSRVGPFCHIQEGSTIGKNCQLVSNIYIGRDVAVGNDCLFYPGVRIMDGCKIGNNAIIHSSTVIGSDGFGFAESDKGLKKVKQVGWVEIEDDVEIGSNTSIDRGTLGATRIGKGTKIDNLVQIAHNVQIGQNCIIVSQVGISGSTKIGNGVMLAGQVGLVGHIELGDGVLVGAQSGVAKSVPAGKTIFGSPALEIMETKRIDASLKKLPSLFKRIRDIEKKLKNG